MKTFGERLKELRLEKGLTGKELGEKFNLTKICISNWEVRDREPSLDTLKEIATFFDVSTDYLIGFSNERKSLSVQKSNQENTNKYFSINLIELLIQNNHIPNPESISKDIIELIGLALKLDVKTSQAYNLTKKEDGK